MNRERKKRSVWFRELVENCVVYRDRSYRDCENVVVCMYMRMLLGTVFIGGLFDDV
ncbi:MAG: hypothetical protein ACK4LA_01645 [Aquificaceae bacterium]